MTDEERDERDRRELSELLQHDVDNVKVGGRRATMEATASMVGVKNKGTISKMTDHSGPMINNLLLWKRVLALSNTSKSLEWIAGQLNKEVMDEDFLADRDRMIALLKKIAGTVGLEVAEPERDPGHAHIPAGKNCLIK